MLLKLRYKTLFFTLTRMDSAAAQLTTPQTIGIRDRLSAFVELTKPRIAFMLVLTAAAGFYVGNRGTFDIALFANAMIGIALLAFGVATLNQWLETRTDALMERTANRPLPSGKVSNTEALIFGSLLCIGAEAYLYFLVNPLTALLGISVIVGYVLLYTPLKTRTTASTAIGAIPGAMPPLMGWTASANEITLGAWALFTFLFLWQFPHFLAIAWMYKDQYEKAGILMLPVVEPSGRITARQIVLFAIMMVPVSLAPFFLGFAGWIFLVVASVLGLWFLIESIKAARAKTPQMARRLLLVSVLYLPVIFAVMVLDKR
jgi:protoheme IX farnesyltransferase